MSERKNNYGNTVLQVVLVLIPIVATGTVPFWWPDTSDNGEIVGTQAAINKTLFLSDIQELYSRNIHGDLQKNRVYYRDVIEIGSISYKKGLGMHAPDSGFGSVQYLVPVGASIFKSVVGIAQAEQNACGKKGSSNVQILVNDIVKKTVRITGNNTVTINVNVAGAEKFELQVDNNNDTKHCDGIAWAEARFES